MMPDLIPQTAVPIRTGLPSWWRCLAALAIVLLIFPVRAEETERPTAKEIEELIASLPTREMLKEDVALFRNEPASQDEKHREAAKRLKAADSGFARLKTLLRPVTSIFDYPGLLARARPSYSRVGDTYSMVLGIPPGWSWHHEQGINPSEFELTFDRRGVILKVSPVLYRS